MSSSPERPSHQAQPSPDAGRAPPPDRLAVGRILAPWGLRGQVKVENLSHVPSRFTVGNRFFIGPREYACREARRQGRTLVVKLQGVDTLEQAEDLRGALREIPPAEAPAPPEGAYYQHQVIGLQVRTTDGQVLGRVEDILETGSNDVYVVHGPEGEKLIPAIPDVVVSVDIGAGSITIQPLPGLFS